MECVKTISTGFNKEQKKIGCGECQTSCQSACKTSCTVANQKCEKIAAGKGTPELTEKSMPE